MATKRGGKAASSRKARGAKVPASARRFKAGQQNLVERRLRAARQAETSRKGTK
jgi:hypothetical protein